MDQQDLWVDSFEEALKAAIVAAGGPKKVASALWPAKSITDAARLLNHCLDPERNEKLALGEIELITELGVKAGCHTVMHYLSSRLLYAPPQPIKPEDEQAKLQREYIEMVKAQQVLAKRMEQMMALREAKP